MSKKPTIEELLAALEEGTKPRRRIETHSNVVKYIKQLQLEPGTKAVPNYFIYWHYRTQFDLKINLAYKANKIVFFRTFSKTFPAHRIGKQRFYLIKDSCYNITPETLKEAKAYDAQYVRFKKEKKTKERKGEILGDSSRD